MLNNVLERKDLKANIKLLIKSMVSAGLVILAVLLPQLVHLVYGAQGGMKFLPMYIPAIIGGILLGAKLGALIGVLSPLTSFLLTSAFSSPMPLATRLPFMVIELGLFGLISGLFSKKVNENPLWAFVAVLSAQLVGRGSFILLTMLFGNYFSLTTELVLTQIKMGYLGLIIQLLVTPILMVILKKVFDKNND